jgi:ligand-binding sensor domain-containing protein
MRTSVLVPTLLLASLNQAFGQFTVFDTDNSDLPSNDVKNVEGRTPGVTWVGTYEGLARIQGSTWTIYTTWNSGIDADVASAVAAESNGDVWVGTFNGLSVFDGTNWAAHTDSLDDYTVYWVVTDNTDRVVVGPYQAGLAVYNGLYWTSYNTVNSDLPDNDVKAIAVANNGVIWAGTSNGLASFNGSTWNVYTSSNSPLPGNNILALAVEPDGTVWISTSSYGVASFDGNTWNTYNTDNSDLPGNDVRSFAVDGGGNIWMGHGNYGLTRFNGTAWTNYNTDNSNLPANNVNHLDIDAAGALLMATGGGFVKLGNPVSVEESSANLSISLAPNPATDWIQVSANTADHGTFTLTDLQGQRVMEPRQLLVEQFIDIRQLAAGQYLACFTTEQGTVTRKVVVAPR